MQGSLAEWIDKKGPIDTDPVKAISAADLDLSAEAKYQAKDATSMVDMQAVLAVVTEDKAEYARAVCLCGSHYCRGSFLFFANSQTFQQVCKKKLLPSHPPLKLEGWGWGRSGRSFFFLLTLESCAN